MTSLIAGGAIGIASSVIASLLFLRWTNNKLPNVSISECMIVEDIANDPDHKFIVFKFINRTKHSILDIHAVLYGNTYQNDEHTLTHLDRLCETKILHVTKYSPKDPERADCIWGGMKIPTSKYNSITNYHDLFLTFIARESYYNTFLSKEVKYQPAKLKENHTFEMGENLTCRRKS